MKEKLRKLDGKPTEPGWYFGRHGTVGVFEVREGTIELISICTSREYTGLYIVGNEFPDMPLDDFPGQWSERIPDCDWGGECS